MFKGKVVLVLGMGDTGFSAARWLVRRGALVRAADSRAEPPLLTRFQRELDGVTTTTGAFEGRLLEGVDLVVSSPGISLREPLLREAETQGIDVIGDVELFARAIAQRRHAATAAMPVIAITGSNGKSTVTSMVGEMCKAAGLRTAVAGNIGLPVLDALDEEADHGPYDIFVLELSSFQLETTFTLDCAAATVLNVTEDHMDRYADIADYASAKARIFHGHGWQILNRDDVYSNSMAMNGRNVVTFGLGKPGSEQDWGLVQNAGITWLAQGGNAILPVSELRVAGLHNAANALAALALCRAIGIELAPLLRALRNFRGLPHRVEWVGQIHGVDFYDDSKGTNVGATEAALNGMTAKVVLIAGGDGKGQDFSPLKAAIGAHARSVILIGRDGPRIEAAISGSGVAVMHADTLEQAVRIAYGAADPGDAVMLSPACASFDMFRNYEHRAQVFVQAFTALARENQGALS